MSFPPPKKKGGKAIQKWYAQGFLNIHLKLYIHFLKKNYYLHIIHNTSGTKACYTQPSFKLCYQSFLKINSGLFISKATKQIFFFPNNSHIPLARWLIPYLLISQLLQIQLALCECSKNLCNKNTTLYSPLSKAPSTMPITLIGAWETTSNTLTKGHMPF